MQDPASAPYPDLLALGEPMIEFNQTREGDGRHYLQGFGGDTSNFIVAAARQGVRCGYVTRLGDDEFGRMFLGMWRAEGVDVRGVGIDPAAPTAVYFVTHGAAGHTFSYLRRDSAASRFRPEDVPAELIRAAKCLHVSGISQAISASACDAVFAALHLARQAGVSVSYDPNLRLKLWPLPRAQAVIEATMRLADVCCPSLDDATMLSGQDDPQAIIDWLLDRGPTTVALKMGPQGVWVANGAARVRIQGHSVDAVDATGCGDCFDSVFVARLLAGDAPAAAGRFANAAAALAATGYGAVAPLPTAQEVEAFLRAQSAKGAA